MSTPIPILDAILANDGFWPAVPVRALVEAYRVPSDARDGMLAAVLSQAMLDTNDAVAVGRAAALAAGYGTLADYALAHPDDAIAGLPVVEMLYLSAVYNLGKAKSIKRLQSVVRRAVPEVETLGSDNTEQYFLDEHQNAVARLLNRLAPAGARPTNSGVYVGGIDDAPKRPRAPAPTLTYQPLSAPLSALAALTGPGLFRRMDAGGYAMQDAALLDADPDFLLQYQIAKL